MRVSVIVPTLDEREWLPGCLESARRQQPAPHELIVADGGSTDGTPELAEGARVLSSAPGRGRQLNLAAREASGEALLFLHADCRLPDGALAAVADCLADDGIACGAFHKVFRDGLGRLESTRWRTRTWHRFGVLFGDQALFLRRRDFLELGGFREDLEAEDAELVRRLRRRGRVALLDLTVETSSRRLEAEGRYRTWARWWKVWLRELRES